MENGKRLVALMNELESMPEATLEAIISSLDSSIFILNENCLSLENAIVFLTKTEKGFQLQDIEKRDVLERFFLTLLRLLHNYVASALSLIDHTRNQFKYLYKDSEDFPEYQAKLEEIFINDPLSQFVKNLRLYCQHYRAPSISV